MHLLQDVPSNVYKAYFPNEVVDSVHNLTGTSVRVQPRPRYFPRGPDIVCAEDPQWNVAGGSDELDRTG